MAELCPPFGAFLAEALFRLPAGFVRAGLFPAYPCARPRGFIVPAAVNTDPGPDPGANFDANSGIVTVAGPVVCLPVAVVAPSCHGESGIGRPFALCGNASSPPVTRASAATAGEMARRADVALER